MDNNKIPQKYRTTLMTIYLAAGTITGAIDGYIVSKFYLHGYNSLIKTSASNLVAQKTVALIILSIMLWFLFFILIFSMTALINLVTNNSLIKLAEKIAYKICKL